MRYQVIFTQGCYSRVDYETDELDNAQEVMHELYNDAYISGERGFDYIIKTVVYEPKMLDTETAKKIAENPELFNEIYKEQIEHYKSVIEESEEKQNGKK